MCILTFIVLFQEFNSFLLKGWKWKKYLTKWKRNGLQKLFVHLHLPQRKPAGLHYKCKTMLLAMKSMMLMMKMKKLKLIITSKYKTVKGDSKVIYVAYYYHFTKLLYVFYSSRCSTPKPCTSKIYEMWDLEAQPDLLNM